MILLLESNRLSLGLLNPSVRRHHQYDIPEVRFAAVIVS